MLDTPAPVFIIGGSRTGSEMLKTMLSASPQLDFVDEIFLYCPRWLHKDLASNIRQHVGSLTRPGARKKLIELLFSDIPYGWFWCIDLLTKRAKIHEGMKVTHHTSDNSGKFSQKTLNNHNEKWVIDTDNTILLERVGM